MTNPMAVGAPDGSAHRNLGAIVLVGVLAGFLAGLFGVGGGILIVPGLVLAAGMDQRMAHGTSLAAVLPISIASLITYATHDNVDWTVAVGLSIGAVAGAVVGTKLLHVLPHRTLGLLFVGILLLSAVRLFIAADADGRSSLTVAGGVALVAIGLVTGILAGLLGVGGGIVMVPAMILLFGIPPAVAKGTSVAVIIPTVVMGTWRNRTKGNADLRRRRHHRPRGYRHRRPRRNHRRQDERRRLQRAVRHAARRRRPSTPAPAPASRPRDDRRRCQRPVDNWPRVKPDLTCGPQAADPHRRRLRGRHPLHRIEAAATIREQIEQLSYELLDHFVKAARASGCSWTQIGEALGVTRQAAQQRHGGLLQGLTDGKFKRFTKRARAAVIAAQTVVAGSPARRR